MDKITTGAEQEIVLAPKTNNINNNISQKEQNTYESQTANTRSVTSVLSFEEFCERLDDTGSNTMHTAIELPLSMWQESALCCAEAEVWYKFTPSTENVDLYKITTSGSVDTAGLLFDSDLKCIAYNYEVIGDNNLCINARLTCGQTYYIMVKGNNGDTGRFSISVNYVAAPHPDVTIEAEENVTDLFLNVWQQGTIHNAYTELWYKFIAPKSGKYTFFTRGSTDTMGTIYSTNCDEMQSGSDIGLDKNFQVARSLSFGNKYYIKVKGQRGSTGFFEIAVVEGVLARYIMLDKRQLELKVGETGNITATTNSEATNQSVRFESDNENVATVDQNGKVTAISGGTATIYVYANDAGGVKESCRVSVTVPVESITFDNETHTMNVGEMVCLDYCIRPNNATNKSVTWCSSDPNVAVVNATSGVITAKSAGATTITATTDDGSYTASCELWVHGKTPVFLIHGRTSNSKGVWGINNNIPEGQNNHFDSDINAQALNGLIYTDYESQILGEFEPNKGESDTDYPCNLGNELQNAGYKKNINLFAFNYPNEDAVKYSAQKFEAYINNLISYIRTSGSNEMKACFYASKSDYNNNNYKINIVGHSMGGLVARYFIENLYQDNHVDKLITICTPHWGSGLADISCEIGTIYENVHVLADHDLDLDSAMFGGNASVNLHCEAPISLLPCYNDDYILTNALLFNRLRATKYYAIAGIDYQLGLSDDNDFYFEMPINYTCIQQIINFFTEKGVNGFNSTSIKNIEIDPKNVDDNMVGFLSQIGWVGDNQNTTPAPRIQMEKIFVDVDTDGGNSLLDRLHSKAPHRTCIVQKVCSYLNE